MKWNPAKVVPKKDGMYLTICRYGDGTYGPGKVSTPWYEFRYYCAKRKNKWNLGIWKIELCYWTKCSTPANLKYRENIGRR